MVLAGQRAGLRRKERERAGGGKGTEAAAL